MTCIKTGAHAYLEEYSEYVYGDAHEFDEVLVFRLVTRSGEPIMPALHFRIHHFEEWFDADKHGTQNSTLIAKRTLVVDLGYDGVIHE